MKMPRGEGGGRPHSITPEITKTICDAIRVGAYMETAAVYAGVPKDTFHDWMFKGARHNRGMKGYEAFVEEGKFSQELQKALAESELRDVTRIDKAANKNWQAAAWKLERRFGKRWGRKDKIDIEHSGKIETEHTAKEELLHKLGSLIAGARTQGAGDDATDTANATDTSIDANGAD